jgi:hypothetical protein
MDFSEGQVVQKAPQPIPAVTPPQAPRNIRAGTLGTNSVTLNWDSASSGVSYKVYYSTQNNSSSAQVLGNLTTGLSMSISSLASGTNYYFWVSTVDGNGKESEKSAGVLVRTLSPPKVEYSVHASGLGWTGVSSDGSQAGTTGQRRQLEAIRVKVSSEIAGGIRYNVHASGIGWTSWSSNNEQAGTTGQNRSLEAVRIELTGDLSKQYDVLYRVHMSGIGWSGWSMNGEQSGTTGQSRRIEAIEIKLAAK